jgi:hypothetical protein
LIPNPEPKTPNVKPARARARAPWPFALAQDLEKVLVDARQEVPTFLDDLARSGGGFRYAHSALHAPEKI